MSDGFSDGVTPPDANGEQTSEPTQTEKNYVEELVGDGKKFESIEDAVNALAKKAEHADNFIDTLKTEKQQLQEQFNEQTTKSRTVDEIIDLLKPAQPIPQEKPVEQGKAEQPKGLTLEDVQSYLKQEKLKTAQKEAADKLWDKLSSEDVFGSRENATKVVAQYIGSNPVRKALVDQMAVADPSGLEMLLKSTVKESENVSFMDTSTDKTTEEQVFKPQGTLTWDAVKRVKKENPKLYNSKAFKNRMHNELPRN